MPTKKEVKTGDNEGGGAPTQQERRLYNAYVRKCLRTGEEPMSFTQWLAQHRGS
jgi:hypothetical protein